MLYLKSSFIVGSLAVLAACGGGSGTGALNNPEFFTMRAKDGVLSGKYNPAGFDARTVQRNIRLACADGKISSYAQVAEESLISFSALCPGGLVGSGGIYEIERVNAEIYVEGTISDGRGNLLYVRPSHPDAAAHNTPL